MSFGFGFGFPRRLTSGGGLSPSLYLDFVGTGVLPSTVTFSRGTNATLTDSNGRIAWAPHNLLTNSEDFEAAAWQKLAGGTGVAPVVTANAGVAPDGTTTADRVVLNRGAGTTSADISRLFQNTGTLTAIGTLSVWMRSFDGVSSYSIRLLNGSGETNVTVTPTWQRFSVESTGFVTNAQIAVRGGQNQQNADILVWGAQLNVANAPVNLLTWSEQFDNAAWVSNGGTVTANALVAPDGTTTADYLVRATAAADGRYQTITAGTSGVVTASVYIKKDTALSSYFWVYDATAVATRMGATITWSGNTPIVNADTGTAAAPQDAGNGWWRIAVTSTALTGVNTNRLYLLPAYTGSSNGQQTAFWGAQLNTGSTALPYVATTSSIYLPPAYNSTTPKNLLGFTQEPENAAWTKSNSYVQQNLLTWSQDFDNAAWTPNNASIAANSTTAPNGSATADTLTRTANPASEARIRFTTTQANATTYTLSVYAKASTAGARLVLRNLAIDSGATNGVVQFNLASGTIDLTWGSVYASGNASIENTGGGWYRCVIRGTTLNPVVNNLIDIGVSDGTSALGGTIGDSIFIWGAQLVQGSTAGDYTQTTSAAAPTRYLNYDGTLTGRKLVETTATNTHYAYQTPTLGVGVYTLSVYLKAAERTWALINVFRGSTFSAYVNLSTGELGFVSGGTATVTNAGNGWWRAAITFTVTVAGASDLGVLTTTGNGTSSYTGDGTSGIYVSDFQLSNSASVDPYVYNPQAAAASAAFYGPRFDYNPTTLAANGLLIEETRANLLTYSEQFDNAAWNKASGATATPNTAVAPDGTTTADTLNTSAAGSYVGQTLTVNGAHVVSVYLKRLDNDWVFVGNSNSIDKIVWFNLSTGVRGTQLNATGEIQPVGNGWYRCSVIHTATNASSSVLNVVSVAADNSGVRQGSVFIWGAQLEAGAFATSYIPTQASQVTRNADSASMLGDNFYTWYNPNQGTYFVQASSQQTPGVLQSFIQDGNLTLATNGVGNLNVYNGSTYGSLTGAVSGINANTFKSSVGYISGASASGFATNGAAPSTFTNPGLAPQAAFGIGTAVTGGGSGARNINGTIRRIGYYNTRLPDSTLTALTT